MENKITDELKRSLNAAYKKAAIAQDDMLRIEHVVFGILNTENFINAIVTEHIEDVEVLKQDINELINTISTKENSSKEPLFKFEDKLINLINDTLDAIKPLKQIGVVDYFLAVYDTELEIIDILNNYGITKQFIENKIKSIKIMNSNYSDSNEEDRSPYNSKKEKQDTNSKTPVLDSFCRDITDLANKGQLDPVIGRDVEMERVAQILSRRKKNNPILVGDPGVGKCLGRGTKILMYDGTFKNVEDIKIGEQLMGVDSTPRNVLSLGSGIDQMYKVKQNRGEDYRVNSEHILSLKASGLRGYKTGDIINITIGEYLALDKNKQKKLKGWKTGVDFIEKYVPIDPYYIGLWLGDGSSAKWELMSAVNPINDILKELNLWSNKHIPEIYLKNSREIRLKVLAGLIDSDGYLTNNIYEILQKNEQLFNDIVYLVRSLGFVANIDKPKIIKGEIYHRMTISGNNLSELPILIDRKRIKNKSNRTNKLLTHVEVIEDGIDEYYGFNIDGDHLFILGDFTVTHNTAIVENLANMIAKNECPPPLQGKRVVALDLASMVAGTKYRGQFEERIKALIDEVKENSDVILFIDEIHTLIGAGNSSGSLDAANVFKPALARGELQCIGATTLDEYRNSIEKDGALDRRFQKVIVEQPSVKQTLEILQHIKTKYEDYHKVTYTDSAIDEIIRLSDRYITTRFFPDKAIDIMDEAGARCRVSVREPNHIKALEEEFRSIIVEKMAVVQSQRFDLAANLRDREIRLGNEIQIAKQTFKEELNNKRIVVDHDLIAEVVAGMTGIPINKISQNESAKLLHIDKLIKNSIIGQDTAVDMVASAIRRNRTGIRRQGKPIGSFLFVGPSGVGKTELAKVLAEKVFGNKDALIRIDMSEYGEKFNASKLIGSPPGYVGYEEGGQLTERVKNKPYSVILFDEMEKAHPDIFNMLLQLLDEGHLTDGMGRKVSFKNTIVIMTSNIGMREFNSFGGGIGFTANKSSNRHNILEKSINKVFRPEFLNRIDEIVYFNALNRDDLMGIINLQLNELKSRLKEDLNYDVTIENDVKELILKNGYNETFGAREIQRTIQRYIEDPLSEKVLELEFTKNPKFSFTVNKENDTINVETIKGDLHEVIK